MMFKVAIGIVVGDEVFINGHLRKVAGVQKWAANGVVQEVTLMFMPQEGLSSEEYFSPFSVITIREKNEKFPRIKNIARSVKYKMVSRN